MNDSNMDACVSEKCSQSTKGLGGWFGYRGRIGRREWWIKMVVANIPVTIFYVSTLLCVCVNEELVDWFGFLAFAMFPFIVASIFVTFSANARRLHDLGVSGWWQLLLLVASPLFIALGCLPGQQSTNKYGHNPRNEITLK